MTERRALKELVYGPDLVTLLLASAVETQTSPLAFLAWFGCICGVYVFGQGVVRLGRRRRPKNGPPSPLRNARAGILHVGGVVEGDAPLAAAVSGKPCFYCRSIVWRQDPAQAGGWEKAAEETQAAPFVLNDSTGRLLVDPGGADVDLARSSHEEYGRTLLATHTDIPAGLEDFLARHKVDTRATLRVEEYLLSPGAEVFVFGTMVRNPEAQEKTPAAGNGKLVDKMSSGRPATEPMPTPQQVIQLTPQTRVTLAAEMTMQSRLAAALTLARTKTAAPAATSIKISESPVAVDVRVEKSAERAENLPAESKAAKPVPPPYVMRQSQSASLLTISYRLDRTSGTPGASLGRAVVFLLAGPTIALASAYFLLVNFGWL